MVILRLWRVIRLVVSGKGALCVRLGRRGVPTAPPSQPILAQLLQRHTLKAHPSLLSWGPLPHCLPMSHWRPPARRVPRLPARAQDSIVMAVELHHEAKVEVLQARCRALEERVKELELGKGGMEESVRLLLGSERADE